MKERIYAEYIEHLQSYRLYRPERISSTIAYLDSLDEFTDDRYDLVEKDSSRFVRALPVHIFKHLSGDCSNGGISSKFNEILIRHDEGQEIIDLDEPPENFCTVVTKCFGGREYKHIEPVARPTGCGWMAGGTICYSCDSRFHDFTDYPLQLHDRQETQKEYDTYSR